MQDNTCQPGFNTFSMGVLITSANFTGKYAIPQQAYSDLDQFINDNEEEYLVDLLGATMYSDFKASLSPAPPAAPLTSLPNTPPQPAPPASYQGYAGYYNIYNQFWLDWGSRVYKSKGMVLMLIGFIFFDYMKQVKFKPTSQGIVTNAPDTGTVVFAGNLYNYLNEATDSFKAIQRYTNDIHPELFNPTIMFNGQRKRYGISMI